MEKWQNIFAKIDFYKVRVLFIYVAVKNQKAFGKQMQFKLLSERATKCEMYLNMSVARGRGREGEGGMCKCKWSITNLHL